MSDHLRKYHCIRCGIAVFKPNGSCNDCVTSDPKLIRKWQGHPLVRVSRPNTKRVAA